MRNARPRWDDLLMTFFRKINRGIINALKRCLCIKDKQILDKEGLQFCCALYTSKSAALILRTRWAAAPVTHQEKQLICLSHVTQPRQRQVSITLFAPNLWNLIFLPFILMYLSKRLACSNPASHPNVGIELAEHRRR